MFGVAGNRGDDNLICSDVDVTNVVGSLVAVEVVERHGGRAWAESEPGKGATFYIEMPRPPSH